jgi:hypothetical protein
MQYDLITKVGDPNFPDAFSGAIVHLGRHAWAKADRPHGICEAEIFPNGTPPPAACDEPNTETFLPPTVPDPAPAGWPGLSVGSGNSPVGSSMVTSIDHVTVVELAVTLMPSAIGFRHQSVGNQGVEPELKRVAERGCTVRLLRARRR